MNKEEKSKEQIRKEAIEKVAEYLRSEGWNPFVGGFTRIEHNPSDLKHNHRLIFEFTGNKPKNKLTEKENETSLSK